MKEVWKRKFVGVIRSNNFFFFLIFLRCLYYRGFIEIYFIRNANKQNICLHDWTVREEVKISRDGGKIWEMFHFAQSINFIFVEYGPIIENQ